MTEEEVLKAMGFEHTDKTFIGEDTDGNQMICRYHTLTHPQVPGLFLGHKNLEGCLKSAVWAIKTLSILNELNVRNVKS